MFPNRIKRVEREVHRVLVDLLREVKDPRVVSATITDVKISKDLRSATVFVSTLDASTLLTALEGLQRAAGMLSHRLGDELDLRRIPRLQFVHDPSLAQGARIDAILASVLPEKAKEAEEALTAAHTEETDD